MLGLKQPTDNFSYPTIDNLDPAKVVALNKELMANGVKYGFGSKAEPLSLKPGEFGAIDCSGEARYLVYNVTEGACVMVDGSADQHDQCDRVGFKRSTFDACLLHDDAVRIAFLRPQDTDDNVGHVMLVINGMTCESHGSHGPDMRVWGSQSFMAKCYIYVLAAPLS